MLCLQVTYEYSFTESKHKLDTSPVGCMGFQLLLVKIQWKQSLCKYFQFVYKCIFMQTQVFPLKVKKQK